MRYTEKEIKQLKSRWKERLLDPDKFRRDEKTGEIIISGDEPYIEIEGCKTYQELLNKRLKKINIQIEEHIDDVDYLSESKTYNIYVKLLNQILKFKKNLNKTYSKHKKQKRLYTLTIIILDKIKKLIEKNIENIENTFKHKNEECLYRSTWGKFCEDIFRITMLDFKKYGLNKYKSLENSLVVKLINSLTNIIDIPLKIMEIFKKNKNIDWRKLMKNHKNFSPKIFEFIDVYKSNNIVRYLIKKDYSIDLRGARVIKKNFLVLT